jgi:hypothetical protein
VEHPKRVDLADSMDQSKQPPLYIHFQFGTQRKAVHALMHTDVGKDRLDNAQPPGVYLLALFAIDLGMATGPIGLNAWKETPPNPNG